VLGKVNAVTLILSGLCLGKAGRALKPIETPLLLGIFGANREYRSV
jgi:hypothetical protein